MIIEKLKVLTLDRMNLDEAVELSVYARLLSDGYKRHEVPEPEWLVAATTELNTEIKRRQADAVAARVKQLKARKTALRSRDEERAEIEKELAALEGTSTGNAGGA